MKSIHSLLLASTALLAVSAVAPPALSARLERAFILAQATTPSENIDKRDPKRGHLRDQERRNKQDDDKKTAGQQPKLTAPAVQAKPTEAPAAQITPQAKPSVAPQKVEQGKPRQQHSDDKRPSKREQVQERESPAANAQLPARPGVPTAGKPAHNTPVPIVQTPAAQDKQNRPPASVAQPNPSQAIPTTAPSSAASVQQKAKPAAAAALSPNKARNAGEFIRRAGQPPVRSMADVRKERHETKDGNRVVIQEDNRTIERDGNRTIIRHNEADRFAVGARNVKVDHRGNETISIILRPNGISIISTTDERGHLLRRVRRDRNGHEMVIIDNGTAGARHGDYFVDVRPPRVRGHNDRYIVDARRARPDLIYQLLLAPPVEALDRHYTVDQVRYSYPLREYMPRVDLGIDFDTGSWQLSPDQVGELSVIANGINRAIDKNPREVFLIEGHTDAVGDKEDNLSLSDRRAEAVAIALTEQFQVPPENLLTQGYGEENLKVATDGPSRENRYVAVRRITPLIAQAGTQGSGSNL
jgi:outer membrane protein OmpA-like peptidoglycan-associated protein